MEKFTEFITQMDEWSNLMKEYGMEAIEYIRNECDGNEKVLKAILIFIMGMSPDLTELVNNYYNTSLTGAEAPTNDRFFVEAFDILDSVIGKKFDEIYALLDSGKNHQGLNDLIATGIAIQTFGRCQLALVDDRSLSQYQYIFDAVINIKDSIDKLQEQIVTSDQDRILEKLIVFKKTIAILENHVQELIIN